MGLAARSRSHPGVWYGKLQAHCCHLLTLQIRNVHVRRCPPEADKAVGVTGNKYPWPVDAVSIPSRPVGATTSAAEERVKIPRIRLVDRIVGAVADSLPSIEM